MDDTHLIDHHQVSRILRYWRLRCLRRIPFTSGMIYNQTVGSLNAGHEQIPLLYLGDIERGQQIQNDRFPLGLDESLSLLDFWSSRHKQPESGMRRSGFSFQAIYWINRFDWLADLHAFAEDDHVEEPSNDELNFKEKETKKTTELCVNILQSWIRCHPYWTPLAWHVPTLARRINNWLYFYQIFFGSSVNTSFDSVFFASISKQLDHLHSSVLQETEGFERILSLACWVNTGLCISSEEKHLSEGIALLSIELRNLFKSKHQELLAAPRLVHETHHLLYHISKGFLRQRLSIPPEIANALQQLEALLQEYKTPDNALARFHGTCELPAKSIKIPRKIIKQVNTVTLPKPALLKIRRDDFEILLDNSSCPKNSATRYKHLSPLSLEIYDGQKPLVINLSPPTDYTLLDQQEYRESAFHSMPVLEDPPIGTIRTDRNLDAQYSIKTESTEQDGGEIQSIICRHNGYLKSVGGILERRLDIWHDPEQGTVIQGRDTLEFNAEPRTDNPLRLISVFHLHPDLEPMPLQGGGMLVHRKKPAATWQFAPIGQTSAIGAIKSLTHYQDGQEPRPVHSLWIGQDIAQAQNLTSYCNEWALFRVKK